MIGFFTFLMGMVLIILVLAGGLRWIEVRWRAPLTSGEEGASPKQLDRLEEALALLESRVDSLQDQQRFLEQLLSERPDPPTLPGSSEGAGETDPGVLFDTGSGQEEER